MYHFIGEWGPKHRYTNIVSVLCFTQLHNDPIYTISTPHSAVCINSMISNGGSEVKKKKKRKNDHLPMSLAQPALLLPPTCDV